MSEKRFFTNGYYINDTYHDGTKWLVNEVEAEEIVDVMNRLDMKARERSKALSKLQKRVELLEDDLLAMNWTNGNLEKVLKVAKDENEQLRKLLPKEKPEQCSHCKFFIFYRNFDYDTCTSPTITVGCEFVDNEYSYSRDDAGKFVENNFKFNGCPLEMLL